MSFTGDAASLHTALGLPSPSRWPDPDQRLPNQVRGSFRHSRHAPVPAPPPQPRPARVIAVYSPKGGVGKTTISTNLAARMARHLDVLLVDLDVAFGDVGPRLQAAGPSALDAIADPALSTTTLRRWLHRDDRSGLWALLAPERLDSIDERRMLSPGAYQRVLAAAGGFDAVVLDCPVDLDDPLVHRFALQVASSICVVVTNERAALVDARRGLDRMIHPIEHPDHPGFGVPRTKVGVIVNQVSAVGLDAAAVAAIIDDVPIVGTIPEDRGRFVRAANAAQHIGLDEGGPFAAALDAAVTAFLPDVAPLPGATSSTNAQLLRLQRDLQQERWPWAPEWLRRMVNHR